MFGLNGLLLALVLSNGSGREEERACAAWCASVGRGLFGVERRRVGVDGEGRLDLGDIGARRGTSAHFISLNEIQSNKQ